MTLELEYETNNTEQTAEEMMLNLTDITPEDYDEENNGNQNFSYEIPDWLIRLSYSAVGFLIGVGTLLALYFGNHDKDNFCDDFSPKVPEFLYCKKNKAQQEATKLDENKRLINN